MIIDAFMFFNEVDTLEIRLEELDPVVDIFILLESSEALSGVKKPLLFSQNKSRFSRFLNKIHHVVLPGLPPLQDDTEHSRFWLESYQRNHILYGLIEAGARKDDIVLISDVDEIPARAAVESVASNISGSEAWCFKQHYYKTFFDGNLNDELARRPWAGTVGVRYATFGETLPHDLRIKRVNAGRFVDSMKSTSEVKFVEDGGWHMTYFGGERAFRYKTANFAHGAGNIYGDAASIPWGLVSREELSGLKNLDAELKSELQSLIDLGLSVPSAVEKGLDSYYHHFRRSFSGKPFPWWED